VFRDRLPAKHSHPSTDAYVSSVQHETIAGNPNTLPPQTYNQVLELGRVGVCARADRRHYNSVPNVRVQNGHL
jgi:hypothetical protein